MTGSYGTARDHYGLETPETQSLVTIHQNRLGLAGTLGHALSEGMAYTGWALAERQVSERYLVFEERAQAAGRGLWKGRFVTPWDWRRGARLAAQGAAE